jgi:hypothetical protein
MAHDHLMAADEVTTEPAKTSTRVTVPSKRRWLLVGGIVVAVLVLAGGAWAVVASQDDDNPSYDAAQIGWMHQGCQQWADSYQGTGGPDGAWCTSMTDWMNQRMGPNVSGQNGMMSGSMMWQDPASMRATCEQWMGTNPSGVPTGTDTTAWCDQMTDWMNQHMGDWDNWMHDGPMMGGS